MAFVHCRECGHEIQAETKQTRCEKCGTFFPFTCAVCDKFLRPPFAAYEDERYVTEDHRPLCPDHYQRQCPECKKWFQADENPGFFLCLACAHSRHQRVEPAKTPVAAKPIAKRASPSGSQAKTPVTLFDYAAFAAICAAAVIGLLFLLAKLGGG